MTFNDELILETLNQEEKVELSWSNKLFGFDSFIKSTEELAKGLTIKSNQFENSKIFKPSIWDFILVGSVLTTIASFLINALLTQNNLDSIAYVLIPMFLIFILVVFIKHYSDKDKNFKIVISKSKLNISNNSYDWNEIYKTYIITRPKQKETGHKYFLVIVLQNGAIQKYDFTNLVTWGSTVEKLAGHIEYYKNFA